MNRAYLTGDIPCDVFTFEKPFGKVDRILQLIPPVSKNVAIKWRFGGYALYMAYRPCSRIPLLVETFWKVPLREKDLKRFLLLSPNAPRICLYCMRESLLVAASFLNFSRKFQSSDSPL